MLRCNNLLPSHGDWAGAAAPSQRKIAGLRPSNIPTILIGQPLTFATTWPVPQEQHGQNVSGKLFIGFFSIVVGQKIFFFAGQIITREATSCGATWWSVSCCQLIFFFSFFGQESDAEESDAGDAASVARRRRTQRPLVEESLDAQMLLRRAANQTQRMSTARQDDPHQKGAARLSRRFAQPQRPLQSIQRNTFFLN